MPTTFEAVYAAVLFVVPGLIFERGIEQRLSYWRTDLAGRLGRFLAWSAVFQLLLAPLTLWLRLKLLDVLAIGNTVPRQSISWSHFQRALPLLTWPLLTVYLILPAVAGILVARSAHADHALLRLPARVILGRNPEPLAWDRLFGEALPGYVRIQLRESKSWLVGQWIYASSYPERQDLTIGVLAHDPVTGDFVLDADGSPIPTNWVVHINREECSSVQYQPFPQAKEPNVQEQQKP